MLAECSFTLSDSSSLTASFTPNFKARVDAADYSSLQAAYDNAATITGSTIQARVYTFLEPNLTFNQDKIVIIDGGWDDSNYTSSTGNVSTVSGTITVRQGTIKVKGPLAVK
jgi:hypothetical protein